MTYTVHAKSSGGEPYKVQFNDDAGFLKVFCHCPAGVTQQVCKHKIALLTGDVSMLHHPSDEAIILEIAASPYYSELIREVNYFTAEYGEIQNEIGLLKVREKRAKARLAQILMRGK